MVVLTTSVGITTENSDCFDNFGCSENKLSLTNPRKQCLF